VFEADELLIVVNNGDDFDHWGLRVCPDLDTVMYTLSGRVDETQGWGLEQETWSVMTAMSAAGGEDWFRLGDQDLATHLRRSEWLRAGQTLSAVTEQLMRQFGVRHRVVPSTDDWHRTRVLTDAGLLEFQDYFVRQRCVPVLRELQFDSRGSGCGPARPSPALAAAMASDSIQAVIVCPSNPVLSVQPLLALEGVREWLQQRRFPVLAVSPFISGRAVKGPAAKIFGELGLESSVAGLAGWYESLVDAWLIDRSDEASASALVARGLQVRACDTLLADAVRRQEVARTIRGWLSELGAEH
jgi:LPPG:FO 2-phospho-L-lactate transferase